MVTVRVTFRDLAPMQDPLAMLLHTARTRVLTVHAHSRARACAHTHTHTHIYIYIYIYTHTLFDIMGTGSEVRVADAGPAMAGIRRLRSEVVIRPLGDDP